MKGVVVNNPIGRECIYRSEWVSDVGLRREETSRSTIPFNIIVIIIILINNINNNIIRDIYDNTILILK